MAETSGPETHFLDRPCWDTACSSDCIHADPDGISEKGLDANKLEAMLRLLFGCTHDCIALLSVSDDLILRYMHVNAAYLDTFKLTREALLGRQPCEVFDGKTAEILTQQDLRCINSGVSMEFDEAIELNGKPYYFQTKLVPVQADGTVRCLVVCMKNVTDLKTVLLQLQFERKNNDILFDSSPTPLFILDEHLKITQANSAAQQMCTARETDLLHKQLGEILRCARSFNNAGGCGFGMDCPTCMLHIETDNLLKGKDIVSFTEFEMMLMRGNSPSSAWVAMSAEAFTYGGKRSICIGIRDITHRKQMEQNLQKLKEDLEHSNAILANRFEKSIYTISKIGELKDKYTAGHQRKVMELACAIAAEMGLGTEAVENIRLGAIIHDIGKLYLPSDILNKPGKITELEQRILQTHALYSYQIIKEMDLPWQIPTMVCQHHERMDGSGYPYGLTGENIIMESRILAVADVVEAMSSYRPYRPALGIEKALGEITENRGTKYDAGVVDTCLKLFLQEGFSFSETA